MNFNEKEFLFTGCSFTYGYGLGYYSIKPYPTRWKSYINRVNLPDREQLLDFQYKNRFSNKVSSHYNTTYKQFGGVSGCDLQSVEWLKDILGFEKDDDFLDGHNTLTYDSSYHDEYSIKQKINPDIPNGNKPFMNAHTLIFQTSYIDRNLAGVWEDMSYNIPNITTKDECLDYYKETKLYEVPRYIKLVSDKVINICKTLEYLGINVYFIHATDVYKDIPYMMDRTIHITHKETKYLCITNLMNDYSETCIGTDPIFRTNPPNDFHPSLECHDSIYKSIVNKLNESNPL